MFQTAMADAGTGGDGAPRSTTRNRSWRRWPVCLWLCLTMTPCPCLQTLMLLMRSCLSRRARSSRWWLDVLTLLKTYRWVLNTDQRFCKTLEVFMVSVLPLTLRCLFRCSGIKTRMASTGQKSETELAWSRVTWSLRSKQRMTRWWASSSNRASCHSTLLWRS